ncbi:MAG: cytochrome c biogenesis protein CcsA [Phycisphaerales bacterium]|nr:cytochrome c biogenesis protein CcsA [Phycisphaerales bacterium]
MSVIFFAVGGVLSLLRVFRQKPGLRLPAKICAYFGIATSLAVLIWHARMRGSWYPLEDNFDALIWLGVLLALFVQYVQRQRPLAGLDWFIMPVVILLLVAAGIFGQISPREYIDSTWSIVHRVTAYGGAAVFAVAGATGAMYLIHNRRLRRKTIRPEFEFGSLERLERFSMASVTLGFALLSVGLITGVAQAIHMGPYTRLGSHWMTQPKVLLAFAVWLIYALVLHTPINPRLRGRRAATLSVLGFVLMVGALVAVQFMPGGTG